MKKFLSLLILLSFVIFGRAQTISFGDVYISDSKTHIPITLNDFNEISSISLKLTYDSTLFNYCDLVVKDPLLNNGNLMTNNINNKIIIAWFTTDTICLQDTIFELIFNNKKIDCGFLNWCNLEEPLSCEITHTDPTNPNNILIYLTNFENKYICVPDYNVNIMGSVKYHNGNNIYPVMVYLYDEFLNYINSYSSYDGNFYFYDIPSGIYGIDASTSLTPSSINSTDALLTMKHYVNLQSLDSIQELAADVNNSGYINSSDAYSIMQKFTTNTYFDNPWIFKWQTIDAYSNDDFYEIEGICRGDVNNSFMQTTSSKLTPSGHVNFKFNQIGNFGELYITFSDSIPPVASISLVFEHTSPLLSISPVGTFYTNGGFGMSLGGIISWFSVTPIKVDTLIRYSVLIIDPNFMCDSLNFILDSCEITDINGVNIPVFFNDTLLCQTLSVVNNENENIKIYNNNNQIIIENTSYETAEIYDVSARLLYSKTNLSQNEKFNIGLYNNGMYIIKLYKNNKIFTKKIVIAN